MQPTLVRHRGPSLPYMIVALLMVSALMLAGCGGGLEDLTRDATNSVDKSGNAGGQGAERRSSGEGTDRDAAAPSDAHADADAEAEEVDRPADADDVVGPREDGPVRTGPGPSVRAADRPLSTFAVDVDTASYDFARRALGDGRLPAPDAVRPEEFVNAFDPGYREPTDDGFSVTMDGARPPVWHRFADDPVEPAGHEQHRLLRVGFATRSEPAHDRPDAALTFVIDVSGSMDESGRMDLVQDALLTLVDELRPSDSVAIVTFNTDAELLLSMTPASEPDALRRAVRELYADGSTNLEGGLVLGYEHARERFREGATNRVILLSDGLPNVGSTDPDWIAEQTREYAGKQIGLSTVGVGTEYGDHVMEMLSNLGDGHARYISDREQARRLFATELTSAIVVRAMDAKVQVAFDADRVETYRLVGYENRALADHEFEDDSVDGGAVGAGHTITALYEVRLRAGASGRVADASVRWLDPADRTPSQITERVSVEDLVADYDQASGQFRLAHIAGAFAELLRWNGEYGAQGGAERNGGPETSTLLAGLRSEAGILLRTFDDEQVAGLATAIDEAATLLR